MPERVQEFCKSLRVRLTWGTHAKREFVNDRYGLHRAGPPPSEVHGKDWELVEAAADGDRVDKVVLRRTHAENLDIVLVLTSGGFVKTVWANRPGDQHGTLDASKYATA